MISYGMLKQKDISKILKISDALLSRILSGDRNVTYKLAKKLNQITRIEKEFWMEADPEELREAFNQIKEVA